MGTWDFNKIKRWALFIFSTWTLLAFIAWHYESSCGMFLGGACWAQYWDGARHVVLLKWVWDYQTLVAGVLALGAGTAVVWAAKYTVENNKLDALEIRSKELAKAYGVLTTEFAAAGNFLDPSKIYNENIPPVEKIFQFTPMYITNIQDSDPSLGFCALSTKFAAEIFLQRKTFSRPIAARCYILTLVFEEKWRRITNIEVKHLEPTKPILTVENIKQLEMLRVSREELGEIAELVEWP